MPKGISADYLKALDINSKNSFKAAKLNWILDQRKQKRFFLSSKISNF